MFVENSHRMLIPHRRGILRLCLFTQKLSYQFSELSIPHFCAPVAAVNLKVIFVLHVASMIQCLPNCLLRTWVPSYGLLVVSWCRLYAARHRVQSGTGRLLASVGMMEIVGQSKYGLSDHLQTVCQIVRMLATRAQSHRGTWVYAGMENR